MTNTVPVQPYETRASVLLSRARDLLSSALRAQNSTDEHCPECDAYHPCPELIEKGEGWGMIYDIDDYLAELARGVAK